MSSGSLTRLVPDGMHGETQLTRRARTQDCEPLWLAAPNGTRFKFLGVREVAKGALAAEAALAPPDDVGGVLPGLTLLKRLKHSAGHAHRHASLCLNTGMG